MIVEPILSPRALIGGPDGLYVLCRFEIAGGGMAWRDVVVAGRSLDGKRQAANGKRRGVQAMVELTNAQRAVLLSSSSSLSTLSQLTQQNHVWLSLSTKRHDRSK